MYSTRAHYYVLHQGSLLGSFPSKISVERTLRGVPGGERAKLLIEVPRNQKHFKYSISRNESGFYLPPIEEDSSEPPRHHHIRP